jgi:anti-anti-sigma factor
LRERLAVLLKQGCRGIVVDLSRLDHMTSAGFRSLLVGEQQAHDVGGIMVIYGLQGLTLELFEIGGFLEMFNVVASREEAIRRAAACSVAD